jgi:hypothetical protein
MSSTTDTASMQRGQAAFTALTATGYHYHFSGRLSDISVSSASGKTTVIARSLPGDYLKVALEPIPATIFDFGPNKSKSFFQGQCGDGCDGSTGPPQPQQTNPPNYGGCIAANGATWYNQGTGEGGCLGPGASRGFPCGTWSWSSPGKGRFRSWDGSLDDSGFSWISLDPDGQTCHLGN